MNTSINNYHYHYYNTPGKTHVPTVKTTSQLIPIIKQQDPQPIAVPKTTGEPIRVVKEFVISDITCPPDTVQKFPGARTHLCLNGPLQKHEVRTLQLTNGKIFKILGPDTLEYVDYVSPEMQESLGRKLKNLGWRLAGYDPTRASEEELKAVGEWSGEKGEVKRIFNVTVIPWTEYLSHPLQIFLEWTSIQNPISHSQILSATGRRIREIFADTWKGATKGFAIGSSLSMAMLCHRTTQVLLLSAFGPLQMQMLALLIIGLSTLIFAGKGLTKQ